MVPMTTDDGLPAGMSLLEAGVPLTLLLDLASGPHSFELYLEEDAELDWLPRRDAELAG